MFRLHQTPAPLTEKYPWMSLHVYCANNPMKYVDPFGLTHYSIDSLGYVSVMKDSDGNILGKKDKFDMLFSGNNSIRVNDQGLLPQLAGGGKDEAFGITSNSNDAFNVFKFAADNSKVEWSLSGFKDSKSTQYYLNTEYVNTQASTGLGSVFEAKDMLFNVHSHSRGNSTKGGSGYMYNPHTKTYDSYYTGTDASVVTDLHLQGYNPNMYVYHRYTQGLFQYTPQTPRARSWSNINSVQKLRNAMRR